MMKRIKTFGTHVNDDQIALGIAANGMIGIAIKNGNEAKAFLFTSDDQIDNFISELENLKFERGMNDYEDSPVQKLIRER